MSEKVAIPKPGALPRSIHIGLIILSSFKLDDRSYMILQHGLANAVDGAGYAAGWVGEDFTPLLCEGKIGVKKFDLVLCLNVETKSAPLQSALMLIGLDNSSPLRLAATLSYISTASAECPAYEKARDFPDHDLHFRGYIDLADRLKEPVAQLLHKQAQAIVAR